MVRNRVSFGQLMGQIRSDAKAERGNAWRKILKKLLLSNSFKLILNYRLGHYFHKRGNRLLCEWLKHRQVKRYACQISYKAIIGKNILFPHPIGIVIGDGVTIGDNVKIWQQVTIGSHGKKGEGLQYPVIGDDVRIFTGAVVIGGVHLGQACTVGALSLVNRDVSSGATVIGIPAKPVSSKKQE
ncbi:serine O-acetyltransferase [Pleomorphovibrio marinus]|uniref:serine O-acetyltransferase n=1 Tax=Pleomorphovibrio marinus TaxID=2164132 RepID=UPI000E0A54E9|nr:hypothetical protein [Pleomorphovibrio marinus]